MGDRLMIPLGVITEGAQLTATLKGSTISITTQATTSTTTTPQTGPYTPVLWDETKHNIATFNYNEGIFYAWQYYRLSDTQKVEAKEAYDAWSDAKRPANWPADKLALANCYQFSTLTFQNKRVLYDPITVPLPTTGGPYAALHGPNPYTATAVNAPPEDVIGWLTEQEVHDRIEALRTKYPHGMDWGNDDGGCNGFAASVQEEVFGEVLGANLLLEKKYTASVKNMPTSQIKAGDVIRWAGYDGSGHVVVVLEVKDDKFTIVHGNAGAKVRWDDEVTFADLVAKNKYYYVYSYYRNKPFTLPTPVIFDVRDIVWP
jgi:plastocyanin